MNSAAGVPSRCFSLHHSGLNIQCRVQRQRAVAIILKSVVFGRPGDNGRTGSSRSNAWIAVFSSTLNTAACCGGSKYSPMISAALLSNSGSLLGPCSSPTDAAAAWLELHGGFANAQFLGQLAARPMGAAVGGFLLRSTEHSPLHRRCRPARFAPLMTPLQSFDAMLLESTLPLGHCRRTRTEHLFDLATGQAIGLEQMRRARNT